MIYNKQVAINEAETAEKLCKKNALSLIKKWKD